MLACLLLDKLFLKNPPTTREAFRISHVSAGHCLFARPTTSAEWVQGTTLALALADQNLPPRPPKLRPEEERKVLLPPRPPWLLPPVLVSILRRVVRV